MCIGNLYNKARHPERISSPDVHFPGDTATHRVKHSAFAKHETGEIDRVVTARRPAGAIPSGSSCALGEFFFSSKTLGFDISARASEKCPLPNATDAVVNQIEVSAAADCLPNSAPTRHRSYAAVELPCRVGAGLGTRGRYAGTDVIRSRAHGQASRGSEPLVFCEHRCLCALFRGQGGKLATGKGLCGAVLLATAFAIRQSSWGRSKG